MGYRMAKWFYVVLSASFLIIYGFLQYGKTVSQGVSFGGWVTGIGAILFGILATGLHLKNLQEKHKCEKILKS